MSAMTAEEKKENRKRRKVLVRGRLSFPHVWKPAKGMNEGDPEKFEATVLIKKNEDISSYKKAVKHAKIMGWGKDEAKWPKFTYRAINDGDEKKDLEGYKGHYYIKLRSAIMPDVIDSDKETKITEKSGKLYAGCEVVISGEAFPYGIVKGNKGVAFQMHNILKVGEGKPFSGKSSAEDDFEGIEVSENDSDDSDDSDDFDF